MNILESVHNDLLLIEAREEYIADKMGDKIIAAYKNDTKRELSLENVLIVVKKISQVSPKHIQWLIKQYINGQFKLEDISQLRLEFKEFVKLKNKLEKKDINQYKDLPELYDALDKANNKAIVNNKTTTSEAQEYFKNQEVIDFYKDNQLHIIIPVTESASCYFGAGTKWCTAATGSDNFFNQYNKDGPLYIIYTHDKKKYQLHIDENIRTLQLMDVKDKRVDVSKLIKEYPSLLKAFHDIALDLKIIQLIDPSNISRAELNEIQWFAVQADGYAVLDIKDPSEQLIIDAIKQSSDVFQYIKNPSKAVQDVALRAHGGNIEYIKNPTEAQQLLALHDSAISISYIKNPSERVQLVAIKNAPVAFIYIKNPTEKVKALYKELTR